MTVAVMGTDRVQADSFIFCTSYIVDSADSQERYRKWLAYYDEMKPRFGAARIFLIDDGSALKNIPGALSVVDADQRLPARLPDGPVMFRFDQHYGRKSISVYPGWWRSFSFAARIAARYGYRKAIHCESDAYVTSERMMNFMAGLDEGWTTFWCQRWGFPETALQVIAGRQLSKLRAFHDLGEDFWFTDLGKAGFAEHILPFTQVNRHFIGDRYGEYMEDYPDDADFVCQAVPSMQFQNRDRRVAKTAS